MPSSTTSLRQLPVDTVSHSVPLVRLRRVGNRNTSTLLGSMETSGAARELAWVDMVMSRLGKVEEETERLREENSCLRAWCNELENDHQSKLAPGFLPNKLASPGVFFHITLSAPVSFDHITATIESINGALRPTGSEITLTLE